MCKYIHKYRFNIIVYLYNNNNNNSPPLKKQQVFTDIPSMITERHDKSIVFDELSLRMFTSYLYILSVC
jgi:hypothetical protein